MVSWVAQVVLVTTWLGACRGQTDPPALATCQDRCDDGYIPNLPCYCNDACYQFENCCFDYYSLCRPELAWSDEWHVYNNHSYKFFYDVVTGDQAIDRCRDHGALLVSINSEEEQKFLGSVVLKNRTLSGFIGASDRTNEDIWLWADGTSVPRPGSDVGYENWYDGQPDNAGGAEHCGIITKYAFWEIVKVPLTSFFWLDHSCTVNAQDIQGYICERTLACESQPCQNNGTCQYIGGHGDAAYECICPDGYVGEYCQIQLIEGATWTDCGTTYLTENEGTIVSPLYPRIYPPNTVCQWTIEVAVGKTLSMEMSEFELEYVKNCVFDSLRIYDGDTNSPLLVGPLCGDLASNNDTLDSVLRSSSNRVVVEFLTDQTVHLRGFKLGYSANDCGIGIGDSGCGIGRVFTANCGHIHVMSGPTPNSFCDWQISVPEGHVINVTFTEFNIEDTSLSCDQGGLTFYDGQDSSIDGMETYCGQRFSWSVISAGNDVYMRLGGLSQWNPSVNMIMIQYETLEPSSWKLLNPMVSLQAVSGTISTATSSPHVQLGGDTFVFKWLVQVPIGELLSLNWEIVSLKESTLRIYDGYSEYSTLLADVVTSGAQMQMSSEDLQATSFRALVIVERATDDTEMSFTANFFTRDWTAVESGCYTPFYVEQPESLGTENNPVRPLEPVVVMASEHSYDIINPGYDAGEYCRAHIEGDSNGDVRLSLLDAAIVPKSRDCLYDGVVVYDGNTTSGTMHGPFCGSSAEFLAQEVTSLTGSMLVVFYSDTRGERRSGGIFRALAAQSSTDSCEIHQLDAENTRVVRPPSDGSAACGVVLSPNFPGLVEPNQWLWRIEGSRDTYFTVYVYYVKGPGFESDCQEFFRVLEISRDAKDLRQFEGTLLEACGRTELFVPPRNIKIPKGQKLGIELNTLKNTAARQWQFKLSYVSSVPDVPSHITSSTESCPPNYSYFRGSCYRYYYWVERHYHPDTYEFQETWQKALGQCEDEGSTLVSIHDDDEAEFLKYKLSDDWLWDPAATWQCNHRVIYIGLHNREGHYQWTDGTAMTYSDWYVPGESWEQPLLHEDTLAEDIIDATRPQPSADESSLCTVLISVSPFKPFNWAKIPCDYPMFRAGVLCERPATSNQSASDLPGDSVDPSELLHGNHESLVQVCPQGWNMVSGQCIRMRTDYTPIKRDTLYGGQQPSLSLADVRVSCQGVGGTLADVTDELIHDVIVLLRMWRHTMEMGHVWIANDDDNGVCRLIKVYKQHLQDDIVNYELITEDCAVLRDWKMYNVLCSIAPVDVSEACAPGEFVCDNGMCTSPDNVCDGQNDCRDASDEMACEDTYSHFPCDNGRHIPLSLRCDFRDQCGDGSDERGCVVEMCGADHFQCDNGECIDARLTCNFRFDCADGSDEAGVCDNACGGFLCYSGRCLDNSLWKDSVSDCPGTSQEDEYGVTELNTMFEEFYVQGNVENETFINWCNDGMDYVQCRVGETRCYDRANTCFYDDHMMDESLEFSVQDTCRTGDHLRNDCDRVRCPRQFHCPGSYCVPFDKVCDGLMHCPGGEDEVNCSNYTCPGLFQCKGESFCLPRSKVCDGVVDCRVSREDEKYCHDVDPLCADLCECHGFSLECVHHNITSLALPEVINTTRQLRSMRLAHNHIVLMAGDFNGLHWLAKLDISHNDMTFIPAGIFFELNNLYELDISNNLLTEIPTGTFEGLISLQKLDLSNNRLRVLENDNLISLTAISHLILTNNLLDIVEEETFTQLSTLRTLNTDAYKFCCIAPQVDTCTPEPDEFSSCEDLLANEALQLSIWVLGMFAFVGNLFVIIWRIKTDRQRVSSFLIINLGMSDFLMGVYMLIIASADVYYRGNYIMFADRWRSSSLCQLAGILAMLSSEVSVFMMSAITADRMVAILFPMKTGQFRLRHARYVAGAGWLVCFFLSILPTMGLDYFGDSFFGRTGVCLPFHLSNDHLPGWEYSVFIFLVINFISFLFIFFGYVSIFMTVKSSLKAMGDKSTTTTNEYDLAKKLAIIVATDFLCWVPIILIGFAALAGAKIPPVVSAWIAVFVLPLNSAVNPLLYTISAINCEGAAAKRRRLAKSVYSSGVSTTNTRVSVTTNGAKTNKPDSPTAMVPMKEGDGDGKEPV